MKFVNARYTKSELDCFAVLDGPQLQRNWRWVEFDIC